LANGVAGGDGSLGQGGASGGGCCFPGDGGGGGGGYNGGGGQGALNSGAGGGKSAGGGGGGGGGSNYTSPEATSVTVADGVQSGNGLITVTYTEPTVDDQLAALLTDVTGLGPGKALANKIKKVQADVAANDTDSACEELTGFVNLVKAQKVKKLTDAQAADFTAQADAIMTTLDC
jgi:hypothetical protein